MGKPDIFLEKSKNNTFRSYDIPLLMKSLHQDARKGVIDLSDNDVQWFRTYSFALQQLELNTGGKSPNFNESEWGGTIEDFGKVKAMVDEMESALVITNVGWNAGGNSLFNAPNPGMSFFDIPDPARYRQHVYCLIGAYLDKLYNRS
jgi:hypothetical protein